MRAQAAAALGPLGLAQRAAEVAAREDAARADRPEPRDLETAVMELVAALENGGEDAGDAAPRVSPGAVSDEDLDDGLDSLDDDGESRRAKGAVAQRDLELLRRRLPVPALKARPGLFMATAHLVDMAQCPRLDAALAAFFAADLDANSRYLIGGVRAAGLCRVLCELGYPARACAGDNDDEDDEDGETCCERARFLMQMVGSRRALVELARANRWLLRALWQECQLCMCASGCRDLVELLGDAAGVL